MAKGKKTTIADFKYVDCFHINPTTGQRTKWVRVEVDKIIDFRNQYNNFSVFNTVQTYSQKVRQEGGGETMYAPLFFDIDSSRTLSKDFGKNPASPGLLEEGLVRPDELFPFVGKEVAAHLHNAGMGIPVPDAICKELNALVDTNPDLKQFVWVRNLETSRNDAVRIIHFFMERFGMEEDEIRVYFSGSKGFHVLVNPVVLDIQPDRNLHRIFKFTAVYLESQLGLSSLDTASIYGHGRQLRMVNSIHHKSGLFKIELYHKELRGDLNQIVDPIAGLAKSPRDDLFPPDMVVYETNELAKEWFMRQWNAYLDTDKLQSDRVTLKDEVLSQMEGVPVCVQFILERGILKNGDRNKATMALAAYYKDIGVSVEEAINELVPWSDKIPKSMTSSAPSEVRASTISCVRTVYTDDRYHFGCAFIRSLHGERKGRDYEIVPCAGRACPAHEDHAIDKEPAEMMHLSRTADAYYTGKKVAFDAHVSGKMDTPYIVPKKVRYVCAHQPFCEKDCIMHDYDGLMEREFHENERVLIEAADQNDAMTKGILFQHSRASCKKVQSEVLETKNVTELLVVPMAERINTVRNKDDDTVATLDEEGNEYVSRKIYAVGNPSEIPASNQHYRIEGYVYSHPRNAMATILTQKHEPKEDSISQFKLTPEIIEAFKVFQKAPGEDLDDRVDLIINDLVSNVTLVRERFEAHLAVLLTYHSCLHYYFQGQLEKRGWMETILVGDSGQAKTQLVNNIMEFCRLGNMTSGEGSSRTGLVYMLEQIKERWFIKWGSYPLSDRRLMALDEFSEMPPDDFGKITEARTTGVLKVNRAGMDTETNARVRLLLLTNPVKTRTLSSYTHGVESLKSLFSSPADIRRLDLAVFLQSGEVSTSVLNKEEDETVRKQLITGDVLRDSILWAWSRKADQIEITKAAMKRILKCAEEMGGKYGFAQDIPLMEPSDLRKKISRISIAIASLVHSTDDAHEKLIVLPEHVEYAADFMQVVYDNKNARLDIYSAKGKKETELTDGERERVKKELQDIDFGDNAAVSEEILDLFRRNEIIKQNDLVDMLGYDKAQVIARIAVLSKYSMVTRTRDGLRKLPKFIEFLNT